MRTAGVKSLKNRLSEYLRLVASGETILVTDRDKVVAELIPPREGRGETLEDARIADLVRRGILTPPVLVSREPPPRQPVATLTELLLELEADRQDR
jgi:antitoxin (DNA-binding transcriptional repressor) of toxin-antitoxin stability system